jgi:hypothetical protein
MQHMRIFESACMFMLARHPVTLKIGKPCRCSRATYHLVYSWEPLKSAIVKGSQEIMNGI